ncbi:hypothetical protein AtDm6_1766 [Acetobacter tropicalis]|uniref:Uncharacterized protein n=1 Tax=Acetobacter tropicalis TaxID=104102 RepID=A0A095B2A0_9PROT|nr:hypothetical protein AtDm6_1766 [Acetobacter tropicalis]
MYNILFVRKDRRTDFTYLALRMCGFWAGEAGEGCLFL